MKELKCPFCNNPLQPTLRQSDEYWCENYDCVGTNIEWVGSKKLWEELIKTKQALDVAVKALEYTTEYLGNQEPLVDVMAMNLHADLSNTLDQIKQITETPPENVQSDTKSRPVNVQEKMTPEELDELKLLVNATFK